MKTIYRIIILLLLTGRCQFYVIAQENQSYILHTIEKGQSLYSIASMYGINQEDIIKLNPGSGEKIYAGHTLRIPRKPDNEGQATFHTIVAGETLYRLTLKYGVTAKEICNANPGLSAENFRAGVVIRIPSTKENEDENFIQSRDKMQDATAEPAAEVKPHCREMHKVKRKETIYSISRMYGISESELIAANPELEGKNKIKRGAYLCIPFAKEQNEIIQNTIEKIPTDKELFSNSAEKTEMLGTIKAAIILPFLNVSQNESARMVEYYEGFLMAVDSLKRTGISIDLYTYNSGGENAFLDGILARQELKYMDIIFGPLYQQHIKPLAEFAQKNNIRLVIPFTSKDNTVFHNPDIYQINTPQSYLYSEVYDHFVRQFPNANVIFIEASHGTQEKQEFIKGLTEKLRSQNVSIKTFSEDADFESIRTALDDKRKNIFIPTSGSNMTLIKILPQLTLLVRDQPECSIHLFGYPEWQTYTKDHLDAFFELDTYFYSSFYTNNLLPAAVNFSRNYRKWYNKEMEDRYPKFGMLGFDTGFFFLKGLASYGTTFEQNITKLKLIPIQTGFKFERVNNWGGFINRKVFFVHFTKNFELIKLDFD